MGDYSIRLVFVPDPDAVALGIGSDRYDEEVVTVDAASLDEARKRVMLHARTPGDGRIVEMYDADGNQLFASI